MQGLRGGSALGGFEPHRTDQQVTEVQAECADSEHSRYSDLQRWTVVAGIRQRLGEPLRDQQEFRGGGLDHSMWDYGTQSPKYFSAAVGITLTPALFTLLIAHGVTRRMFAGACGYL